MSLAAKPSEFNGQPGGNETIKEVRAIYFMGCL